MSDGWPTRVVDAAPIKGCHVQCQRQTQTHHHVLGQHAAGGLVQGHAHGLEGQCLLQYQAEGIVHWCGGDGRGWSNEG